LNSTKPFPRSPCAVANSLDIVGDKWSLLVVRDLLHGKSTYGQLVESPERIPTNILAEEPPAVPPAKARRRRKAQAG
jgi:DNA-binding HxlR family transcriptional regulator